MPAYFFLFVFLVLWQCVPSWVNQRWELESSIAVFDCLKRNEHSGNGRLSYKRGAGTTPGNGGNSSCFIVITRNAPETQLSWKGVHKILEWYRNRIMSHSFNKTACVAINAAVISHHLPQFFSQVISDILQIPLDWLPFWSAFFYILRKPFFSIATSATGWNTNRKPDIASET